MPIITRSGLAARLRPIASREVWLASAYLLLNAGFGVIWAFLFVTVVPLGVALAYTLVGLVILAAFMRLWMLGAGLERSRLAAFFGIAIQAPYRPLPERGPMARALARAGDPAAWRDLLYLVILFPLGVVEGALVLLSWAAVLAGVVGVFYLPTYRLLSGAALPEMLDHTLRVLPMVVLAAIVSLVLATVQPRFIIFLARGHVTIARALLAPRRGREAQLAERVEELSASRSRLLEAALTERRRIERDLHDGAQQRLVAVAMSLGMAREKMETDPAAAAALVEEAHEEAKRAIRDIRDLVRGVHPAVLSDRGLDAAISALAVRSPIPVDVLVEPTHRHPDAVESAAYFVVAEALTNVARHSDATRAWVNVVCRDDRLVLEVADDGSGGADPSAGTGLAGLADRLAGLDGRLFVASPPGGPTLVRAELPCK
jgi:signal transduction histidine kinase